MYGMSDSCYTCRRRRIQCDKSGIPCAKCEKSGFECFQERPLRWVKGVTLRSKFHDSVLRPSAQSKNMPAKIQADGEDVQVTTGDLASINQSMLGPHHESFASAADRATVGDTVNSLVIASPRSLPDQAISNLDKTSRYYLDYCKYHF